MTRYRWFILTLLFLITTNNYLDRVVFSVLIPVIRGDLRISDQQYGYISAAFQGAYTIGFLFMGKLVDLWGTRFGYSVAIMVWSAAAVLHAAARSALQLSFWRGVLGIGETGNFPAAVKAVAEWFPRKDRSFAIGVFNSGSGIASVVGPPLFVWLTVHFGWRACFVVTGSIGFVLLVIWWIAYRPPERHPWVNKEELAYINSDRDESEESAPQLGWSAVLKFRETWGFAIAKFLTDPVWWFYLVWLPPYLYDVRHLNMTGLGWAIPVVYTAASVGSVAGGWLSGIFIRRGWHHAKARKLTMAICASLMPLGALSVPVPNLFVVIGLVGIATAAHQGWSANLFTTTSDTFPRQAVASVTGFGSFLGGLGSVIFSSLLPGWVVTNFGYTPIFLSMGLFHLTGLLVVHLLLGKMQMVRTPQA